MLSSLEGTAVTSARIEGITHEYTAIPGVLEDVIDVMLNLKGLVVKTDSKESQHLRIDVDKPGPVLASDIQLPAGVKVVNPDWLICTVADGGSFHADVIVDTGKDTFHMMFQEMLKMHQLMYYQSMQHSCLSNV